jgi:SWIM zinc finger
MQGIEILSQDDQTMKDLSVSCRAAVTAFAEALVDKEKYLGNHIQMYTTNCMDSETTTPVESQNSIVKEKLGISGKMDIFKGIEKIAENTNRTIQRQKEEALRMLNQANMASRSPTKDIMIPKSQAIADGNFDCRNQHRIVKAGQNEWWCWNFDRDTPEYAWPWSAIPQFVRVRKMIRKTYKRQTFIRCDCGYYDRIGNPCAHIFWLVDGMST